MIPGRIRYLKVPTHSLHSSQKSKAPANHQRRRSQSKRKARMTPKLSISGSDVIVVSKKILLDADTNAQLARITTFAKSVSP